MKPKILRYGLGIWLIFELISIGLGLVRTAFITPQIGKYGGHVIGTILLIFFVLIITRLLLNLMDVDYTHIDLIAIGVLWLFMTLLFEFSYGYYVLARPWPALLAEYNILEARLGSLVLITEFLAPFLGFSSFKDREGTAVIIGMILAFVSFAVLSTPMMFPFLLVGDIILILQVKNKPKTFGIVLLALQLIAYFTSYSFLIYFSPVIWLFLFVNFHALLFNKKQTLWVHGPSMIEEGEVFDITVEAWDSYERLAGGYEGEICFDLKSYTLDLQETSKIEADLPGKATFTSSIPGQGILPAYFFKGADNGKKTFEARIFTPGVHYLIVKEGEGHYRSNPLFVKPKDSERKRIFWGDLHGHTWYSDGAGSLKHAYNFARRVALVDFTAVTDHLTKFLKIGRVLRHYFKVAENHNDPPNFVTFPAIEWSPGFLFTGKVSGHFNLYFKNAEKLTRPLRWTASAEIYEYMQKTKRDLLAWPHHTVKKEFLTDWGYHNEEMSPVVEIWSVHGSSEETQGKEEDPRYKGYAIQDALRMGYRVGLITSSDTHDGRLGHPISHTKANHVFGFPYSFSGNKMEHGHEGGLVAVYADELTRDAIFHALKTRRCYASSWVTRPLMFFEINSEAVGEQNSTVKVPSKTAKRELKLFLCADGVSMEPNTPTVIKKVEIYKNAKCWKSFRVHAPVFKKTLTDTEAITGTTYEPIKKRKGYYVSKRSKRPVKGQLGTKEDFYYVRMTDSKGNKAWIGSLWVVVSQGSQQQTEKSRKSVNIQGKGEKIEEKKRKKDAVGGVPHMAEEKS